MNGDYPTIFMNGINQPVHRLEWEKHFGPIPNDAVIHHKDGNKKNWDIFNLQILSRAEHIREHSDIVHRKGVPVTAFKNGLTVCFDSIEHAADFCGTYTMCVHRIFKGKQKRANGWLFTRG